MNPSLRWYTKPALGNFTERDGGGSGGVGGGPGDIGGDWEGSPNGKLAVVPHGERRICSARTDGSYALRPRSRLQNPLRSWDIGWGPLCWSTRVGRTRGNEETRTSVGQYFPQPFLLAITLVSALDYAVHQYPQF